MVFVVVLLLIIAALLVGPAIRLGMILRELVLIGEAEAKQSAGLGVRMRMAQNIETGVEAGANWIRTASWTAGAIASLLALLTPPFRRSRKFVHDFITGPSRIGPMEDRVASIEKQLKPNGGTSLFDVVDAIKRDLSINTQMTRAAFPTPKFLADKDGRFLWVSSAWCATVWLSEESCGGVGWKQMICEKDRDAVLREWRACVEDKRQFLFTFCVRRGSTTPETIEVEMTADPLPQGFFLGSLKELKK